MKLHRPHLPVTLYYLLLTAASFAAYWYLAKLPQAVGIPTPQELAMPHGNQWEAMMSVWFIFAWGFGLQSLVQIYRVFRREPREANLPRLLRHGIYMSIHAGFFEEIIFRVYAFLSFVIATLWINAHTGGWLETIATATILPLANLLTLGLFQDQISDWAIGLGLIAGSLFFRSAHLHYGKFSKLNVWFIGLVMFWLLFNYGLPAAIAAHFLYDFCVFTAIALTAPIQPRHKHEI